VADPRTLQRIGHELSWRFRKPRTGVSCRLSEPDSIGRHLYSEAIDPTAERFSIEPCFEGAPRTMVDEINLTLAEEMRRDPKVVVFGEDVADCGREESLREVKGKGGVFKATAGLQIEFGSQRCFNTRWLRPLLWGAPSAWPRGA